MSADYNLYLYHIEIILAIIEHDRVTTKHLNINFFAFILLVRFNINTDANANFIRALNFENSSSIIVEYIVE